MSLSLPSRQLLRACRTLWVAFLAAAGLSLLAPAADAAVVSMTGADPADVKDAKFDLTSAKVTYDSTSGKVSVAAQTVASSAGVVPMDVFVLVGRATNGTCTPDGETTNVLVMTLLWRNGLELTKWVVSGKSADAADAVASRSGTTISSAAGPSADLKNLPFDCAQIMTKTVGADENSVDVDSVVAFAEGAGGADKDKDGVPDASDKCPTVPGGDRFGCLTISAKQAVRLGAKRVAIDKMVARTGSTCPVKAKVTVKVGKKTVGRGVVSVTSHGSFCRVYGVVKLKKSVKKAKITVKASGMGSIAATRKR